MTTGCDCWEDSVAGYGSDMDCGSCVSARLRCGSAVRVLKGWFSSPPLFAGVDPGSSCRWIGRETSRCGSKWSC